MQGTVVAKEASVLESIPFPILERVASLQYQLDDWQKNPRIGDVLSRTVLLGGKRLRPLLTFLMGELFGLDPATTSPYARAVELVHASTLAHDDVIDNASSRRGLPSINAVSSNKQAVLAGDYLLAYVLESVAELGRNDIVVELARVIGDLAEGEWLQIENARNQALQWADIERVALKKTGSVLRWCSLVPALLSHNEAPVVEAARRFGELFGIAFQVTDDILDFKRQDGAEFQDQKSGVINAVMFEVFAQNGRGTVAASEILNAAGAYRAADLEAAIDRARQRAHGIIAEARAQLAIIVAGTQETKTKAIALRALHDLVDYVEHRVR